MREFRRLLRYVLPYRVTLAFAVVSMVGVALFTAAFAGMMKFIFDDLLVPSPSTLAFGEFLDKLPVSLPEGWEIQRTTVLWVFVFVGLAKGIFHYFSQYLMAKVGFHVSEDLRNGLYESYQRQSLDFFARRGTGDLITHIVNDASQVQTAVTAHLVTILQHIMSILGLLGVMFACDWRLALVVCLFGPPAAFLIYFLGRKMKKTSRRRLEKISGLTEIAHETLAGVRVVKVFRMEDYEMERFRSITRRLKHLALHFSRISAIASPLMEFGGVLLATGLLWWGYHKISTGLLAPGNFAAFTASLFSIYGPLKHISNSNNQIQAGLAAAQRIFALLDVAPSVMEKPGALPLTGVAPEVVFKNVRFRYPGADSDALNGIMLTVRPGETVALVGPSGAGKTTLAGLLPRFYDVSEGAVEIGGRDVRDCTLNSLRGRMAIVTQETHLFNDSAANNIRYGRWDASREDIERAARDANAHGFIEALPEGYETPIGENGRLLSGGQRQRLAIARALIKDPDILILDEATSDLDARSEAAVQEALYRLLKGRTAFVIAHRLSTVLHASRIVVMEHGRITATGNHEELLRNNALYQELCRLQFMKESATALS